MRRSWNTTSRIGNLLAVAALTLCGLAAPAAAANQVPFTATGTAVITGVTNLPGGLVQVDFSTSGNATHLGNVGGPLTRIQDHQGNFGSTAVFVAANGTGSVFLAINGRFERTGGKCVLTSTGTYTVTGGTGAFANATGSGTTTQRSTSAPVPPRGRIPGRSPSRTRTETVSGKWPPPPGDESPG